MTHRYQQHLIDSSDVQDIYKLRATLNRPQTVDAMRVAIHELLSRGMSDHTVASVTGLSVQYIRNVIGERQHRDAGASL